MALCIASYEYLRLSSPLVQEPESNQKNSQNALEFTSGSGQQKDICAAEITVKGLIRGTPGEKSFVHGRMLCVPGEEVLSAIKQNLRLR